MTKRLFILFLLLQPLVACQLSNAQGITFHEGSWQDALNKARATGKPIFVDYYTTWCGPCKWMSANTFKDAAVGSYANANYIPVKIDCEKGEGPALAGKARVEAYPTIVFYDATGKEIGRQVGAMDGPNFLELLKKFIPKGSKTGSAAPLQLDDYLKTKSPVFEKLEERLKSTEWAPAAQAFAMADSLGKLKDHMAWEDAQPAFKALRGELKAVANARFWLAAHKYDKAAAAMADWEESERLSVDTWHWLAYQFSGQDPVPADALRWLNNALRRSPSAEMLDTKAYLQLLNGRYADAAENAKLAVKNPYKKEPAVAAAGLAQIADYRLSASK